MKYAVITGGTKGIGKAIAEKLLQEGISVALCARTERDLDALRQEWQLQYPGCRLLCIRADLRIREDVETFGNTILSSFPQVDILVHNGGIFLPGTIGEEPEGTLEQLMQVNLFSAYQLTRLLLPGMKARREGHIFNISSVAGLQAYENGGAYSITKYALLGFSDNLRHELMPYRIRVTAICPGATYTASWEGSGVPRERMMNPEDVAEVLWSSFRLSPGAVAERIIMRPVGGDL